MGYLKNKRGSITATLLGVIIVAVIAVSLLVASLVSTKVAFIVIGIGIIVGGFVSLGKIKNSKTQITVLLIALIVGIALIFGSGLVGQSFLSLSEVTVKDGTVYWVVQGSANRLGGEGYDFVYNPDTYTKADGTEVKPQESLTLNVKKEESKCVYSLNRIDEKIYLGLYTYTYYTLDNPERVAKVKFSDDKGNSRTIDGTTVQSFTMNDPDGKGKIDIETQGTFGGKFDCPNYENVAIIYSDNSYEIVDENDLDDYLDRLKFFPSLSDIITNVDKNTEFITGFDEGFRVFDKNRLEGKMDLGNVVFTVTADQDYFDSIIYEPEEEVDPEIENIVVPSSIKEGTDESMAVSVSNKKDNSGTAILNIDSNDAFISPSSKNFKLEDYKTLYFDITAGTNIGSSSVGVEVCSSGQFGGRNCDSESQGFEIIEEKDEPDEYCGDGTCQASESYNTCPEDCTSPTKCGDGICQEGETAQSCPEDCKIDCAWYETYKEKETCGLWCKVGLQEPTVETGCYTAALVYIAGGVIIILGLGTVAIVTSKKKSRPIRRARTSSRRIYR